MPAFVKQVVIGKFIVDQVCSVEHPPGVYLGQMRLVFGIYAAARALWTFVEVVVLPGMRQFVSQGTG